MSTDDESPVPPQNDQGDYGYELDQGWHLPRKPADFRGLSGLVPGFYDAQGKSNDDWKPLRWVHKSEWVDDEDFKHHPVSTGMSETVYSPKHRAILYWTHIEPLHYARRGGQQPQQQQGQPANRPQPAGPGTGDSGSSQHWSDYPANIVEGKKDGLLQAVDLKKTEGKQIAEEDMTPLSLSDFWMFDWVRVCKAAGHPVGDLKHVIMPNVVETHTLVILKELMGERINQWGPWPGQDFKMDGNEPLLGTPLGVTVAKLLVQRHEMFGTERTLIGGHVWWTPPPAGSPENHEGSVGLMFTLDDPPTQLLQQQRAALSSSGNSGQSSARPSGP